MESWTPQDAIKHLQTISVIPGHNEEAFVIKDGKVLGHFRGGATSVRLPIGARYILEGADFFHCHPLAYGLTRKGGFRISYALSAVDIDSAFRLKLRSVHAVANYKFVYSFFPNNEARHSYDRYFPFSSTLDDPENAISNCMASLLYGVRASQMPGYFTFILDE